MSHAWLSLSAPSLVHPWLAHRLRVEWAMLRKCAMLRGKHAGLGTGRGRKVHECDPHGPCVRVRLRHGRRHGCRQGTRGVLVTVIASAALSALCQPASLSDHWTHGCKHIDMRQLGPLLEPQPVPSTSQASLQRPLFIAAQLRQQTVARSSGNGKSTTDQEQEIREALQAARSPRARPIDPREARRGTLDFVQVRDWDEGKGKGQPQLENLEVQGFAQQDADVAGDLYTVIAKRLQLLEAKGLLQEGQVLGNAALPSFEKWSMTAPRYLQYLANLLHIHTALERATAAALTEGLASHSGRSDPSRPVVHALQALLAHNALDRSHFLRSDSEAVAKLQAQSPPPPDALAAALSARLASLANAFVRSDGKKWRRAALRLMAHFYCVHVTYLTVGTRIGSSAAEKLDLFQAQAINAWRSYPQQAGRNPVLCLMGAVNTAGEQLGADHREVLLEELPAAFLKSSVLLRCLAYED